MSAQHAGEKYRITNHSRVISSVRVYRVQALRDLDVSTHGHTRRVKAGEVGGFIMAERNLSQQGNAWVADEAVVMQHGCLSGDALLEGQAQVKNWAQVAGASRIYGTAVIGERVIIGYPEKMVDVPLVTGPYYPCEQRIIWLTEPREEVTSSKASFS